MKIGRTKSLIDKEVSKVMDLRVSLSLSLLGRYLNSTDIFRARINLLWTITHNKRKIRKNDDHSNYIKLIVNPCHKIIPLHGIGNNNRFCSSDPDNRCVRSRKNQRGRDSFGHDGDSFFSISSLNLSPKWPKLTELLAVFSNEAPLTIACMFIISAALSKCRIIEQASKYLSKFCVYGYSRFMLVLLLLVAVVSAFVNNTPVVVVLLPVVMSLSRDLGVSSSKMLIPLSYASIFGVVALWLEQVRIFWLAA